MSHFLISCSLINYHCYSPLSDHHQGSDLLPQRSSTDWSTARDHGKEGGSDWSWGQWPELSEVLCGWGAPAHLLWEDQRHRGTVAVPSTWDLVSRRGVLLLHHMQWQLPMSLPKGFPLMRFIPSSSTGTKETGWQQHQVIISLNEGQIQGCEGSVFMAPATVLQLAFLLFSKQHTNRRAYFTKQKWQGFFSRYHFYQNRRASAFLGSVLLCHWLLFFSDEWTVC